MTVGTNDDIVRNRTRLEGDIAAHQIRERDVLIRHAHTQNRFAPFSTEHLFLLLAQITVETVVPEFRISASGTVTFLNFLGR